MRNQVKVNHNHVNASFDFDGKLGTIFDPALESVERAGYVSGALNVDNDGIVWFKTVGCCGFMFIRISRTELPYVAASIRMLQRTMDDMRRQDRWFRERKLQSQFAYKFGRTLERYFDYTDSDRRMCPEWDNCTCTRNARLNREGRIAFLSRVIYGA